MWILVAIAASAEPTVLVQSDGTVVASAVVAASADAIHAVVDDLEAVRRLSPEVLSVTDLGPTSDRCHHVRRETKGLFRPLHFLALRCRTATGWHEELVESEDFADYTTDWSITPVEGGTRVEYRVHTSVRLVPASLVAGAVKDSAVGVVANLVRLVAPQAAAR